MRPHSACPCDVRHGWEGIKLAHDIFIAPLAQQVRLALCATGPLEPPRPRIIRYLECDSNIFEYKLKTTNSPNMAVDLRAATGRSLNCEKYITSIFGFRLGKSLLTGAGKR